MTRDEFFAYLAPIAVQVRNEGSPIFPSVRLAQNLLETGGVIPLSNNLGGMKVGNGRPNEYWNGKSVNKETWEVYNNQRVDTTAAFRAYDSIYNFYKDQDLLFQLPRYERVRNARTPEEQAHMLQASGYATDPQYALKLVDIINRYGLLKYDQEAIKMEELRRELENLKSEVNQLKTNASMSVPEWAKAAVEAAVYHQIIDTPNGRSFDFYSTLTVLYRLGLIKPIPMER